MTIAFPRDRPSDLDDLRCIADHDWASFQALKEMRSHWQRPGWTDGRRSYHWMLTFPGHDGLARHVVRCRAAVPAAPFDMVDTSDVHLTLGRIGFTDEITESTLAAVHDRALAATGRPPRFDLTIGPLTGSRGAVRFSVAPWAPLLAAHAFLTSVTADVLRDRCVMSTEDFRPHVSIAYARDRVPVDDVVPGLLAARDIPGPRIPVDAISLVLLQRRGRSYRLTALGRVPLVPQSVDGRRPG